MVPTRVTKNIPIPPGVDTHTRLRVSGEGDPSRNGGPRGDCYCYVVVPEHPLFHRDGRNLLCQVPITYTQAALGAKIEVPTLDGRHLLEVPAGTQSGDHFQLPGRGMPDPRRRRPGDLIV